MSIDEAVWLVSALVVGLLLGLFYFGGLYWTVCRLATSRQPVLLTLGSFWARLLVTVAGFYLVAEGRWQRLLACLVGFVIMRTLLVFRWGHALAVDSKGAAPCE